MSDAPGGAMIPHCAGFERRVMLVAISKAVGVS